MTTPSSFQHMEQADDLRLLSYGEAAAALNRSVVWLRRQVRAGVMPHHRGNGTRSVFFTREDIDEFLRRTSVPGGAR